MARPPLLAAARRAVPLACVLGLICAAQAQAQLGPVEPPSVPTPPAPLPDPNPIVHDATDTVDDVVQSAPNLAPRNDPSTGGGGSAGSSGAPSAPSGGSSPSTGGSGDDARAGGGGAGERARTTARERRRAARRDSSRRDRGGRRDDRRSAASRGDAAPADAPSARNASAQTSDDGGGSSGVTRTLNKVVEVIPTPVWAAMILLALLAFGFFGRSHVVARRAKRLRAQREELLQDVGLLQQALLPEIPEKLGELATSVAYRPADGPAAGGDFYDAFLLDGERVAIIVGDVSGHGRAALARTALMRYTLRAYLDAGLEPRRALKVAGKALDDDMGGDFATVVLAVHDPAHATLTYSCAGHPPPLVAGSGAFEPVTALSSPPIGVGLPTGQRQTTLHLPGDALACFFTDGLVEAKHRGELIGRERLAEMLADLGPHATAGGVIDAIAFFADEVKDDMAACVLRPDATGAVDHVPDRVEEVELNALDLTGDRVERFLAECGVKAGEAAAALKSVEASIGEFGGALLRIRVDKAGVRCEIESAAGLHDPLRAASVDDTSVRA